MHEELHQFTKNDV
jgi:hypothetical protein